MSTSSSFCFLAGAGIVRSWLVHRELPEAPPAQSFCVNYVLACARKMWVLPQSILYVSRFLILHSNHHCTRSLLTTHVSIFSLDIIYLILKRDVDCDILHEEEAVGRSKIGTTSPAIKLRVRIYSFAPQLQ